jgi:hypothetical protein
VPPVGPEPRLDVLSGEAERGFAVDRDLVVVAEVPEPPKPEVARQRRRVGGDALDQIAIAGS